jgi:glycosyltransferase involved in cell wall biosynthesis
VFDPLLRLAIPFLERRIDVSHVYGEIAPWLYTKVLKRKPRLLTIASEKGEILRDALGGYAAIAVQTEAMRDRLVAALPNSEVHLIYPGIDLAKFVPRSSERRAARTRILFATFPRAAEELGPRGVLFLLEAASACPHLDFHFVSRPWRSGATALQVVRQELDRRRLANVTVSEGVRSDMASVYHDHDLAVIPYTTADGGKECPRSLVEGLACGLPALISDVAPFASFVRKNRCGEVYSSNVTSFSAAVESAMQAYPARSASAVASARTHFDRALTRQAYEKLYQQLAPALP